MNQPYPSGHVEYSFKMHADHARSLTCNVSDARIQKIEINKISPDDPFDQKWRLVIIFNEVNSTQEVDKLGAELMEGVFALLSFSLKERITDIRQTGHGLVPREGEGAQCHLIMPSVTISGEIKSGGRKLSQAEIHEIENNLFTKDYSNKLTLINLFSYAMKASDQVVQFMLFYLILYEIFENQNTIDKHIMSIDSDTVQITSPHNDKLETIYTKLRNEITHRGKTPPEETRNGIIDNLYKFKEIVFQSILIHPQRKRR